MRKKIYILRIKSLKFEGEKPEFGEKIYILNSETKKTKQKRILNKNIKSLKFESVKKKSKFSEKVSESKKKSKKTYHSGPNPFKCGCYFGSHLIEA